jgi:hypothetical protein
VRAEADSLEGKRAGALVSGGNVALTRFAKLILDA